MKDYLNKRKIKLYRKVVKCNRLMNNAIELEYLENRFRVYRLLEVEKIVMYNL